MNNTIFQLEENTINQISAGEVIDSPYSIVKELIENSLDASANHIIIRILDGGKRSIEVLDNGCGMSVEDMKICYLKHTTSKIKNVNDISLISTMGFRGEALSSISSVSKTHIQSKRNKDLYGYEIFIENSVIMKENICPFNNNGTRIIVDDLFYNVPVRKSFLESEKTSKENKQIIDLVHRLSLSSPHVRFELFIDNLLVFRTFGDNNIKHVLMEIYDKNLVKNLLYIDTEFYGVQIKGFISKAEDCIGNKMKQTFFVNNRYVKMDILNSAVKAAYNEYIVSSKFPICILFLNLDKKQVDVNFHPRKTEIKFQNDIFPSIVNAVKNTLEKHKSAPSVLTTNSTQTIHTKDVIIKSEIEEQIVINNQKTIAPEQWNQSKLSYNKTIEGNDTYQYGFAQYPNLKFLTQVHSSYLVAEYDGGMIMIDQHAAHERVLYEKFVSQFNKKSLSSFEESIPETIELNSSNFFILKQNMSFFKECGFLLEEFGGYTFIIRKYPSILHGHNVKDMIYTLLDEIYSNEKSYTIDELVRNKIIMRSCKKAIKANMKLTTSEVEKLLNDLMKCENPYHCPHGRPIIISFSMSDIEKLFNRIV